MKTALVFGASGLVGSELVKLLAENKEISSLRVFNRRTQHYAHPKIEEIITDLNNLDEIKDLLKGDLLYICLGTTINKAGSKEAFEAIDLTLPVNIASLAKANSVPNILVVSSLGADAKASNFYLCTKGKMEEKIQQLKFERTLFLRPSMLLGKRKEFRLAELVGKQLMKLLGPLMIGKARKYRAIEAKAVAQAMLILSFDGSKTGIFDSDKLQEIAG